MSFRIRRDRPVSKEIRRIALEQLDRADRELKDPALDADAAIHQIRKRCKRLRGLLRLCRGSLGGRYRRENARYRDAARRVSGLRDAEVLIETYDWVLDRAPDSLDRHRFAFIRRRLTLDKRRRMSGAEERGEEIEALAAALAKGREKVDGWARRLSAWSDTLDGFERNFRQGRRAMREAVGQPSTGRFHEWRKRTKYLCHHLKLLEALWPPVLRAHRLEAGRLADLLGREHDLAVFQDHLERTLGEEQREVLAALCGRIAVERGALRLEINGLGARVFGEGPKSIRRRLQSWMPD